MASVGWVTVSLLISMTPVAGDAPVPAAYAMVLVRRAVMRRDLALSSLGAYGYAQKPQTRM